MTPRPNSLILSGYGPLAGVRRRPPGMALTP